MKTYPVILWLPLLLALMTSCQEPLPLTPTPAQPADIICSEDKLPLGGDEYIYRQSLCAGTDSHQGSLYAWKLHTLSGEPPSGSQLDPDGWLLREDGQSIWTSEKELNLDYRSQNGKLTDLITSATLRIKAPDGQITEFHSPFKTQRIVSSHIFVTFPNGATTSTGLCFNLAESVGDIFVEGLIADHFMYRLNIINSSLDVISHGEWYSSITSPDIRQVILNESTLPALEPTPNTRYTQFEAYVVSRQGVEEATPKSVYFHADGDFYPDAVIHSNLIAGLGDHHYSINRNEQIYDMELIPSQSYRRNGILWKTGNVYSAVHSPNFKLHLHWGYNGQYGYQFNGNAQVTNNPLDSHLDNCVSESGVDYHGHIVAYDLSLDGERFPVLPQFIAPQFVTHADGSMWLRVRNIGDSASACVLSGLSAAPHIFKVCAVDAQGRYDQTPAVITINLVPYKAPPLRNGILIVDGTYNNSTYTPEALVDAFYASVVPTTWGPVETHEISYNDPWNAALNPALLQNYKAVIWHQENPSSSGDINLYGDALEVFLDGGGKLILSGNHWLNSKLNYFMDHYPELVTQRFGISNLNCFSLLSTSVISNPWFIGAEGLDGIADIDLELEDPMVGVVETRQGIGGVLCYDGSQQAGELHRFVCKPVTSTASPPSQEQYNTYSTKYVSFAHQQDMGITAVFGFPLSYMEVADVSQALSDLLSAWLGTSYASGGHK